MLAVRTKVIVLATPASALSAVEMIFFIDFLASRRGVWRIFRETEFGRFIGVNMHAQIVGISGNLGCGERERVFRSDGLAVARRAPRAAQSPCQGLGAQRNHNAGHDATPPTKLSCYANIFLIEINIEDLFIRIIEKHHVNNNVFFCQKSIRSLLGIADGEGQQ